MTDTSARPVPQLPRFDHSAFYYHDEDHYVQGIRAFLAPALMANDPVLVAVPGGRLDLLVDSLADTTGRIRFEDMSVAGRNPGRIIPGVLLPFAEEHPGEQVWIIGEPIWSRRSDEEYPACVVHEALVNLALAGLDAIMLCPYDARGLRRQALLDAVRTHPVLQQDAGRSTNPSYSDPASTAAGFSPPLPPPPDDAVSFDIGDEQTLVGLRDAAARHAKAAGLCDDRVAAAVLTVNELAANTVEHTGGPGRLRVWNDHGRLVFQIDDSGYITDPLAGRVPPPWDVEGGRGLLIVHELCDLVLIHTGRQGTSIRLPFQPGTAARP